MISKKEVQHVAKLARLGITKKEEEKFVRELSSILDYFEKLKKANVSKVKPTSHPYFLKNITRKDIVKKLEIQKAQKLVEMAPNKKEGYIEVKAVLQWN